MGRMKKKIMIKDQKRGATDLQKGITEVIGGLTIGTMTGIEGRVIIIGATGTIETGEIETKIHIIDHQEEMSTGAGIEEIDTEIDMITSIGISTMIGNALKILGTKAIKMMIDTGTKRVEVTTKEAARIKRKTGEGKDQELDLEIENTKIIITRALLTPKGKLLRREEP